MFIRCIKCWFRRRHIKVFRCYVYRHNVIIFYPIFMSRYEKFIIFARKTVFSDEALTAGSFHHIISAACVVDSMSFPESRGTESQQYCHNVLDTYVYVYIYTYTHVCVYIYIYTRTHTHIHTHTHTHIFIHIHKMRCMPIFMKKLF